MSANTRTVFHIVFAFLLAALSFGALAHTAWLEANAESPGAYHARFGGHEGKTEPYDMDKLKAVAAFSAAGNPLVVVREDGDGGTRVRVDGEAAVLTLSFDNGVWSRPEGARMVNKPMNEVPGAISGVHAMKYHKTIAHWGEAATRSWQQPFELVPVDAAPPVAGSPMRIRVLIDGEPAVGVKVAADESADGTLTDANGIATVIPQAGLNILWAGQRTAIANDDRFTTLSIEYILAFDAESAS